VSNGEGRARLTIEDVLRSYAAVAREEIRREHLSQSCVASTWLTIETLGQYGVEAHPLEVLLSIGNRTYKRLRAERGAPRTQEELEGWYEECGAHVIGVGFDLPTAGTIGGHIVAAVGTSFLVDASIDQAAEPEEGITPPSVLVGAMTSGFAWGAPRALRLDTEELFIEYARHRITSNWRASPDWGENPQTRSAVARIRERMTELLQEAV
jgi:hypothetical protein